MGRNFWIGANDRLRTATPPILGIFTLFAWVKPDIVHGGTVGVVDRWDGGANSSSYALILDTNNIIKGLISDGAGQSTIASANPIAINRWTACSFTHRGTAGGDPPDMLYINGKLDAAQVATRNPVNNGSELEVGNIALAGLRISGSLAHVAVWTIDLLASEQLKLAAGVSPLRIRNQWIKGYWPLETGGFGSYNTSPDISGNSIPLDMNQNSVRFVPGPPIREGIARRRILSGILPTVLPSDTPPTLLGPRSR